MIKEDFVIIYPEGFHARPASKLAELCMNSKSDIKLIKSNNNMEIDPRSIIGIMSLGVEKGDSISIIIDGDDEKDLLYKIKELLNNKNA